MQRTPPPSNAPNPPQLVSRTPPPSQAQNSLQIDTHAAPSSSAPNPPAPQLVSRTPPRSCVSCLRDATTNYINCRMCRDVFHYRCVENVDNIDQQNWICSHCQPYSTANAKNPTRPSTSAANVHAPSISSKSSTTRRKIALQLQRLEEEKMLQEKRDKDYLSKKYQLLEDLSTDDDESVHMDEVPVKTTQRVDTWVRTVQQQQIPENEKHQDPQSHYIKKCSTFNITTEKSNTDAMPHNLNRTWMGTGLTFNQNTCDSANIHKSMPNPANSAVQNGMLEAPIENSHALISSGVESPELTKNQLAARQALPKELPVFNGYAEEWPLFISSFESTTKTCGFSDDENLVRLQRCLKGKALDAVRCRLLHPRQVSHVIATLRMLFGKPEMIINSLLLKIRQDPPPRADKLESIVKYALAVENICATMEMSELKSHLNNPLLLQELVDKLPPQIRLNWGIYKQTLVTTDLMSFSSWLFNVGQAATEVTPFSFSPFDVNKTDRKRNDYSHLNLHEVSKRNCLVCDKNCQSVEKCAVFTNFTIGERWEMVKQKHLCRTCLRSHRKRCFSSKLCGEQGCTYRHHRLLHKVIEQTNLTPQPLDPSPSPVNHTAGIHSSVLFKVIPVNVYGDSKSIETYAFLDDGSSVTLIEEQLANELNVSGESSPLHLKWTANTVRTEENSRNIDIEIAGMNKKKYTISGARTVASLALPSQSVDSEYFSKTYKHLQGLPIPSYVQARPRILIGLQHWKLGLPLKTKEGKLNEPVATKTRLGWVVFGPCMNRHDHDTCNVHICECQREDQLVNETVKQYFSVESVGTKKIRLLSSEEEQAEKILEMKSRRIDQRFEVPLLWRYNNVEMPSSKANAERRLICLERKMAKEPNLRKLISELLQQYLEKGYALKVEDDIVSPNKNVWYLPIFPVFNPNKPNKVRIVWDAASKVNGISLNSLLLSGPDITSPLLGILFRFRERKVGICGDIREMFHQIRIAKEDQDAQRFLWRNKENGKIETYKLVVMTFGATCSPYCAQYIKNKNAREQIHKYPDAANSIILNHYVDDYIDSFSNEDEAVKVTKDVIYVHSLGGFQIRNFRSNSTAVIKELESFACNGQQDVAMSDAEKVLGLWWSPKTDEFFFVFDKNKVPDDLHNGLKRPTKREVLRMLMKIYDPLGLISNVLISLKILLQNIWRSGINCDEEIKPDHYVIWCHWIRLLPLINEIRIPRTYINNVGFSDSDEVELHVFCDASEEAYAAVAYLRIKIQGKWHCRLISSKTKVAPLRPLSIPRMELEAALLGTRLASSIIESHTIVFKRKVYWTDSKTVFYWIKSGNPKCKQVIAIRIGEILERTEANDWRWVPSKVNSADEATRSRSKLQSFLESRWYSGPEFLRQSEEHWPQCEFKDNSTKNEIAEHLHHSIVESQFVIDVTKYSCWRRLLNVITKLYDFVRKSLKTRSDIARGTSVQRAECYLFRQAQLECFPDELGILKKSKSIPKTSTLHKLTPYLDTEGVMRIQGRIDASVDVHLDTKRPIVLARNHYITFLIVDYYHRKYHHQYNEIIVNEVRQRFYIPHLRVFIKSVRRKCQVCSNMKAKPYVPIMGELPPARLKTFTRPFSFIGIDYFGPMSVAVGRRREKRWGVLITCLTVRAIHIEIAHSLSADSCILALQRFIARRGMPIHIYSDNGTNFRGASQELKAAVERIDREKVVESVGEGRIKWTFIPPASPHMGGSWERLIRSVKQTLGAIMPTRNPRDELLLTMMAEVEGVINTRPLTYVPLNGDEDEAITPNHFLLGSSSGTKPLGEFTDEGCILKRNWMIIEQFGNSFWRRWIREYLPDLTRRTKWFQTTKAVSIDDIVIVIDENSPRNIWPKGRVIKTIKGGDGVIRSAMVQTATGVYLRPTSKLAVLDVAGSSVFAKPDSLSDLPGGTVDEPGNSSQ